MLLQILHLDGQHLRSLNRFRLCESRQLNEILPNPNELHVWNPDEIVYLWNSEEMAYEIPIDDAVVEPETRLTETCYSAAYGYCGFAQTGTDALAMFDATLANPPEDAEPLFLTAIHYYRALTLEELDRSEEALAEYVAIYEGAPESAWGMLAALHFERVQD